MQYVKDLQLEFNLLATVWWDFVDRHELVRVVAQADITSSTEKQC